MLKRLRDNLKLIWWILNYKKEIDKLKIRPPLEGWKKLLLTTLGVIVLTVGPQFGLDPEQCKWIAGLLGVSIAAFGVQDIGKAAKAKELVGK